MSEKEHAPEMQEKTGVATRKKPANPKLEEMPPWKVLLHNDDVNEMGFVIETICMLTPLAITVAAACTMEAHSSGLALLLTTHKERAELYQEQFHSRGLQVTIEPA